MRAVFIFVFVVLAGCGMAQDQLKNTYSTFSEVYGGTEDSGVSRTESYTFVAYEAIELKGIYLNKTPLRLKKGDTLIVNVGTWRPYVSYPHDTTITREEPKQPDEDKRFVVVVLDGNYFANVQWPYTWPGTLEYLFRKQVYTARIKEGFDTGYTFAAP